MSDDLPQQEIDEQQAAKQIASEEVGRAAPKVDPGKPVDPPTPDELTAPDSEQAPHENFATDESVLQESRRKTRRSFLVGGVAAAAAYGFHHWLSNGPHDNMLPTLLDRTYDANAAVSRAVFRDHALAPTYPLKRAETLRVNGVVGLAMELETDSYRLQVVGSRLGDQHPRYARDVTAWQYGYSGSNTGDQGHDTKTDPGKRTSERMAPDGMQGKVQEDEEHTGRRPRGFGEAGESFSTLHAGTPGLLLTLEDITKNLPRHELVTQFKCIEGWSQVVHWAGVRIADFLELYPPALVNGREPRYVYMETPNGDYYVGYDLHICRHPQSLFVTEMMGAPLTQYHGAPLRVHMPTKYGYKQIKRVGLIAYTDELPDDYWTELGYDWYGGL